jgi:putative aminopeptidase FrvX
MGVIDGTEHSGKGRRFAMSMPHEGLYQRLEKISNPIGPSGFERAVLDAWQEEAGTIKGGTLARFPVGGVQVRLGETHATPRLITGHIDEIGVIVTGFDASGCLRFRTIGGWDPSVLCAQRIVLVTRKANLRGVVVRKGVHLMEGDERNKITLDNLWIDIGCKSKEEAQQIVRPGDFGVIDARLERFGADFVLGRALDNRVGAFAVLEAARRCSSGVLDRPLVALATTCEEIGGQSSGAGIAGITQRFHEAVVVDMGFESGHPDFPTKTAGERTYGSGVTLHRGGALSEDMFEKLEAIAERDGIPYTIRAIAGYSGTDADGISRSGCPTTLVSVPIRYMHTPCEMARLDDIEALVGLLVAFASADA